jgi:hypothetical protein
MTTTYEVIEGNETTPSRIKATLENGVELWIPTDPANSDYQAYLNPVEHLTEIPTPEQSGTL